MASKKPKFKFGDKVTVTRFGNCIFEGYEFGMNDGDECFVLTANPPFVTGKSEMVAVKRVKRGWKKHSRTKQ